MTIETIHAILTLVGYLTVVLAAFFGMKSAIQGLRRDYEQTSGQVERIECKVDDITETLVVIQKNSARQEQHTSDIQNRVVSIEGRVTYLERRD